MTRVYQIDILKVIALLGMVSVHYMENMAVEYPLVISSWVAPMFCFAMGMAFHYSSQDSLGPVLRRSLFLFVLGSLVTSYTWGLRHIFNWDILHLLALITLSLYLLRRLPRFSLTVLIPLLILLHGLLWVWVDGSQYWDGHEYGHLEYPQLTWLALFVTGYFPLPYWLGFSLFGLLVARSMEGDTDSVRMARFTAIRGGETFILALPIYLLLQKFGYPGAIAMYPAPGGDHFLGNVLVIIMTVAMLHRFNVFFKLGYIRFWIGLHAKFLLTHYALHLFLLNFPLRLAGTWKRGDDYGYLGILWDYEWMLLAAFTYFVVTTYLFSKWFAHCEGKGSLDWLLYRATHSVNRTRFDRNEGNL